MKTELGESYIGWNDSFETHPINCTHANDYHIGQIVVYGSAELAALVDTLLENHFRDRPTTNQYNSTLKLGEES